MVGKLSIVLGPLLISVVALAVKAMGVASQTASRIGIAAVSILFITGGILFYLVDEDGTGTRTDHQE